MAQWLVRQGGSKPIGPVSTELVLKAIEAGRVTSDAEVARAGTNHWLPIDAYPEFAGIVFDDQGPTHVVDSPWFAQEPPSAPRRSSPRASAPSQSGLGLPAPRTSASGSRIPLAPPPTRPAVMSQSMPRTRPSAGITPPPPSRVAVPPTQPLGSRAASLRYNEVDDDAATRVANPHTDRPSGRRNEFSIDDETMTRVQGGRRTPGAPQTAQPRRGGGILPTLPMASLEAQLASREGVPPRPAAGAPPPVSVREDLRIPETQPLGPMHQRSAALPPGSFPPIQPTPPPPQVGPSGAPGMPQPQPPPNPYQTSPPPYDAPRGYYPPQPPPYDPMQPYTTPPSGDQGLKALVALIVFLAVALAIVLVLLFIRQ